MFDSEAVVTFQGTVTAFEWTNPHVYIMVEVTDGIGQATEWEIEGDPTALMTRSGWTATTIAPGDVVTAIVNPARGTQRTHARLVSLATSDGAVLTPRSRGNESTVRATGIAGVWDNIRAFATRSLAMPTPTAAGATWQAAYTNADSPTAQCIPLVSPFFATVPYRYEIELLDDRILFRSEFYTSERTVFMDGRGHPESAERTLQGHSIGWWEGEALIVDTVHFSDLRNGNLFGIPSGAQKHVVERYELSEDGTRLLIDFVLEDPNIWPSPLRTVLIGTFHRVARCRHSAAIWRTRSAISSSNYPSGAASDEAPMSFSIRVSMSAFRKRTFEEIFSGL